MKGWILVTGAAKRIGKAIALELAASGWDIIIHYNTSITEAATLAAKIKKQGQKACLAEIDLTNETQVKNLIPALAKELGPLRGLVNNASLFEPDGRDPDDAMHLRINAEAPRLLSEQFEKHLPGEKSGVIINILDADPNQPSFSSYNKSKKALHRQTLDLALRFAPHIRVNGVALGPVLPSERESPEHFRRLLQTTPLKTAIASETVAQTVRFLIETPSLTGAIIPVDNGMHLKYRA